MNDGDDFELFFSFFFNFIFAFFLAQYDDAGKALMEKKEAE